MYGIKQDSEIIIYLTEDTASKKTWSILCDKYNRRYILKGAIGKGIDEVIKMSESDLCYTDKIVLLGQNWKEYVARLETMGYTLWKNIFPEWFVLLKENSFQFEDIKNYTKNNIRAIGEIFEYIALGKKIAGVYGNCQSFYLAKILENTDVISKDYIFCEFLFVQNMKEEAIAGFYSEYMRFFSLFIYQNVKIDNVFGEKLATKEYVLKTLNQDVITVSFPYVYFGAYYPQYIRNARNDDTRRGEGHTPYGDVKIQSCIEKGYSIKKTIELLQKEDLFSDEEVQCNLDNAIEGLRVREAECDVQMLDFILQNYQTKYLFYSPAHPTNICMEELARRILAFLKIETFNIDMANVPVNDSVEMYIYPSTKAKLQLSFDKKNFGFYKNLGTEDSLEEYVTKYLQFNFPEFSNNLMDNGSYRTIDVSHLLHINQTLISERRTNVLTLNGRTLHLGIYLTAESDLFNGCLLKIEKTYAPKFSYSTPIFVVGRSKGGVLPCIITGEGEFTCHSTIEKGDVLIIDTTWTMK